MRAARAASRRPSRSARWSSAGTRRATRDPVSGRGRTARVPPGWAGPTACRGRQKPARQTFRSVGASREATRAGMTHDGCPGLQALPRRLRRPRHGLRTTHRRPTLAFRFRPETWVSGRSLAAGLLALGAPEEHALAARAEDHLCVALDLVEELGWDAHAAALADTAAHLDHC